MIRRTATAIAFALLWAPAAQGFVPGATSAQCTHQQVSSSSPHVLAAVSAADNSNDGTFADFEAWEALDQKNAYRKKYGLKPMTPEEFLENEAQIQQISASQEQRKLDMAAEALTKKQTEERKQQRSSLIPGFLEKMMAGGADTCESNYDCERPQVCCDFGFTRKCCSSGMRQRSMEGQLAYVPVPVEIQQDDQRYY